MISRTDKILTAPSRNEFYTNYPLYRYWNNEGNAKVFDSGPLNIYIHIPFCIQICDFCFYMKELAKSPEQIDSYVDGLCDEIRMTSDRLGLKGRKVESIYIGGGTPSILTEKQIRKIGETLAIYHDSSGAEFTLEAEPGTFSEHKLEAYKDIGVNRVSMGVQSFDDEVIHLSHRKHDLKKTLRSIQMVQSLPDTHLNIDLMSGMVGDNLEKWRDSLHIMADTGVDMVTIYKMKVYANTVFFREKLRDDIELCSDEEEVSFIELALDELEKANYSPWMSYAFSKQNYQHRYTENIWRGMDLMAYGVSSFGKYGNSNYQNTNNISQYINSVKEKEFPIARSYHLTAKDKVIKELLLCSKLMSYTREEFELKMGFDFFLFLPEVIADLVRNDYLESGDQFKLTRKGLIYSDFVAMVLAKSLKDKLGPDEIGFEY